MSTWDRYWNTALEDIEENERRVDDTWREVLAALIVWELWLRKRTVRGALRLPVTPAGFIDWTARNAISRFRRSVYRDTIVVRRNLARQLQGTATGLSTATRGIPSRSGLVPRALRSVAVSRRETWRRLEEIRRAAAAGETSPRPAQAGPRLVGPNELREIERQAAVNAELAARSGVIVRGAPPPTTPAKLGAIEERLTTQPKTQSARELADELEVGEDAVLNIARNLGYELGRVYETTIRLTGRHSRPDDMAAYMDGDLEEEARRPRPFKGRR